MSMLIYAAAGVAALLLCASELPGRYPELGGAHREAFWISLACAAAIILYRTFSGPRRGRVKQAHLVALGSGRGQLAREAGISLAVQVVIPLTLLASVCRADVSLLFAPLRGLRPALFAVTACVAATILLPPRAKAQRKRAPMLRQSLRALPYLLLRAGLTEEVLFRGCLQTAAVRLWGPWIGIGIPVLVFSGGHVCQAVRLQRANVIESIPLGAVAVSLLTRQLPASVLLGLLWHATGNLWACILLHGWLDALYLGAAYAEAKRTRTGESPGDGAHSTA